MFHFISWKRAFEGHRGHCYFCWKVGLNFPSFLLLRSQKQVRAALKVPTSYVLHQFFTFANSVLQKCLYHQFFSSLQRKDFVLIKWNHRKSTLRKNVLWNLGIGTFYFTVVHLLTHESDGQSKLLFLFNFVSYEQRSHWKWSLSADFSFPTMGWWSEMIWPILRSIC